jgi:tetratricopeptide (TPR) repeat protein
MRASPKQALSWSLCLFLAAISGGCASGGSSSARTGLIEDAGTVGVPAAAMAVGGSSAGNYLAGRQAAKDRDFGAASDLLGLALRETPSDEELLQRTFLAKLSQGRIGESTELARRIVGKDTVAPLASLVLIVESVKSGSYDAALTALAQFPDRGFSGFMKPLLTAWVEAGKGRADAAFEALEPLRRQSGLRVLYELHAALIADVLGRTAEAADHYKRAIEASPRATLRVVEGLGRHLERTGEAEKAKALYRSYMGENPDSVVLEPALARIGSGARPPLLAANASEGVSEALFDIASTMTRDNSAQIALIYGQLAIHLRPDFDLAQMLVGGILESMDRYGEAIDVYSAIPAKSPLRWSARLRIAGNLEALKRDADAIALLRQLSQDDPSRPEAFVSLGDLYRANKEFKLSVAAYDQALKVIGPIQQRHWTILYSRGISLERSQQWERAERDFQRALELNPEQPYVLNYLGYSWVDQGLNLDKAKKMIERAVELRPNDGYIIDSLGWVLYRLRDFAGAVEKLERAVELRPQDPTINDHLGDAYWRVGRYNEARFQWHRALVLQPEPEMVSAIEAKLQRGLADEPGRGKDS